MCLKEKCFPISMDCFSFIEFKSLEQAESIKLRQYRIEETINKYVKNTKETKNIGSLKKKFAFLNK